MSVMYIRDKNGNLVPVKTIQVEPGPGGSAGYVVPGYWQEHIDSKVAVIKALQDAGGKDCVSFVVLTDMHHPDNKGKCSPALARKIMEECGIKYALVLGDTQTRGSFNTKAEVEAEFVAVEEMLEPIADRMLRTQGNHDGTWGKLNNVSYPYNFTPQEMYNRIYRKSHLLDGVRTDSTGTGYYVDDNAARMRYIVLNTHCNAYELNADGSAKYNNRTEFRFTQSQYDLVVDALTNMPEGYSVAVFGHVPIQNSEDYNSCWGGANGDHSVLRGLLTAYRNKTAYSGRFSGTAGGGAAGESVAGTITTDTRLSSTGSTKDSTGAVVTDYIPCKQGDVLRIKGLDIKTTLPDGSSNPSIVMYDAEKAHTGTIYTGTTVADAVTTDTDGSTMYTLAVGKTGEQLAGSASMVYIRICGTPISGEDIIVTLNKQIVASSGGGYDAVSVDADFSTAKGELVGYFAGHTHNDFVYPHAGHGIDIITHRCDAAQENVPALLAERVPGTITEQSFDVVTVNRTTRTINCTKIGAGNDRAISY